MTDQNTFMETLRNVAEIVRTSEKPMSEKEILSYFEDMELDDVKKQLVLEYLNNPENLMPQDEQEAAEESQEEKDGEDSKVFQMYLEELAMLPGYSEAEKMDLYERLLAGEQSVIETISMVWLEKVLTIAKKYLEPKLNVEDLVQEGNMALFMKLQELCDSREKCDVEECLSMAVEQGIVDYASEMSGEREAESTLIGRISLVHEAKVLLTKENGRIPTVSELAEYTKMTEEELLDLEEFLKITEN